MLLFRARQDVGRGTAARDVRAQQASQHLGLQVALVERGDSVGALRGRVFSQPDGWLEAWRLSGKAGVDVVVNFTGGETWAPSLRTLKKGGRLVTCGATAGFDPKTDLRYIWVRELTVLGSNGWTTDDIRALLDDVAGGRITPVISHVLPLAQGREAEDLIESRAIFGKVLVVP